MTKKQRAEETARMNARLLDFRKEQFKARVVELSENQFPGCQEPGEVCLSITKNGSQWTSISLLRSEAEAVIKLLQAELDRAKPEERKDKSPFRVVLRRDGRRWALNLENIAGSVYRVAFRGSRVACKKMAWEVAKEHGLDRWYEVKEGRHSFGVLVPVMVEGAK